jgi:hypothetical protein
MDTLEVLIGHTVRRAARHEDALYLKTDTMTFALVPYGDCCANCFIADLDGAAALVGGTVRSVEDLEQKNIRDDDCDVVDVWGHRVVTERGICTIGMRVEHNGYYGGRLNVNVVDSIPDGASQLEDFTS